MVEHSHGRIEVSCLSPKARAGFEVVKSKHHDDVVTLSQVHGAEGHLVSKKNLGAEKQEGDFLWTCERGLRIGVHVADCTPLLALGEFQGKTAIAAIHAGWRGTAKGVIAKALASMNWDFVEKIWMGPSICQNHFQVGLEVLRELGEGSKKFAKPDPQNAQKVFLDLKAFQCADLRARLPKNVEMKSDDSCTYCEDRWVSYRQSGPRLEARQLAWIQI